MNRLILIFLLVLFRQSVYAQCVADAGKDSVYCGSRFDQVELGGSPTASGDYPPFQFKWETLAPLDSSILTDSTIANPLATLSSTVKLILTVTDSKGNACYDSVQLVSTGYSTDFEFKVGQIKLGDSVQLRTSIVLSSINNPPYRFQWFPADGLSDPNIENPKSSPSDTTYYKLTITDRYGCRYFDEFQVWVDQKLSVNTDAGGMNISYSIKQGTLEILNPSTDRIFVELTDLSGKTVHHMTSSSPVIKEELHGLSAGIYVLQIAGVGSTVVREKVVITR
ncbi:MAG: T9SS type A sorting domain-containing protein [Flavobacteriales bacterium]|nr:T9SS type A sorting domain-containing protein [Bacteroidota bacterium]MCB9239686.1 T9SS type A sorting domain-containing protein [Flavobacteriales bacterium]